MAQGTFYVRFTLCAMLSALRYFQSGQLTGHFCNGLSHREFAVVTGQYI
ncbi:MAG: hypothetical protein ACRENG_07545 [bacterium]